eukprot:998961_1
MGYSATQDIIKDIRAGQWWKRRNDTFRNNLNSSHTRSHGAGVYAPTSSFGSHQPQKRRVSAAQFEMHHPSKKRRLSAPYSSFLSKQPRAIDPKMWQFDPPIDPKMLQFDPKMLMKYVPPNYFPSVTVNHMIHDIPSVTANQPQIPQIHHDIPPMTSTDESKPLRNETIAKPLTNATFSFKNKAKKSPFKFKKKGKKSKKKKELKWFERTDIYKKTEKDSRLHRIWRRADWESIKQNDAKWKKLTAFERGTLVLALQGEPMSIEDIKTFFSDNICSCDTGTMILNPARTGKVCAAMEGGYYFVVSDDEDSDDANSDGDEQTPGALCLEMWETIIEANNFLKGIKIQSN